ncbi:MAG: hypothetical protein V8R81_00540 [Clostridia bacterium]
MNIRNIKFIESEAFENKINIKLCNELINFVYETSSNKSKDILDDISKKCIWFRKSKILELQEICEIKYFGELLERYEEKVGGNSKNIRAIALALGYAKDLITSNMIIGNQLIDFINKIKKMSENDIYLKGALYLYDNKKYSNYIEDLLNNKRYESTEDIFFVISLSEDIETSFNSIRKQLLNLIGKNKTISAINNVNLYSWFINRFYNIIKKDRKKEDILLKKIIYLPTKQIKKEDDTYKVLSENGYSQEEIAYLNYALLFYVTIPNKVRIGCSITEERIAINLCKVVLNNPRQQNEELYNLIENMISEYRCFEIKCSEKESLKQAIIDEINIENPITYLKFYNIFNNKIYGFNILDNKWDILVELMDNNEYEKLFDRFIGDNDFSREDLKNYIEKYNSITKKSYIDTFYLFYWQREDIFKQLVDKGIINLVDYFQKYEEQHKFKNMDIEHLKRYVNKITTREAFCFLKYILEYRKYKIEEIDIFEFNLRNLFKHKRYYYETEDFIDINKKFLSIKEKQKLLYFLDNYIFKVYPEEYMNFIISLLNCEYIKEILSIEELREIYFMIIKINSEIKKDSQLRKKYLTKQELEDVINRENEEKIKEKKIELKRKQEEITRRFMDMPKGIFKNMNDFCRAYRWENEEWDICCSIVKKYLIKNVQDFEVSKSEVINFMNLLELLIESKAITLSEVKKITLKYMKEDLYDGNIKRAC